MITTLPTDSAERKNYPMLSGCLKYFPAALAGISRVSKLGNDKHNPGQPLHHDRNKSTDHGDCIIRHLTDTEDLLAAMERNDSNVTSEMVLLEANQLAWRALAYAQTLHEKFGAPLAPSAKTEKKQETERKPRPEKPFKIGDLVKTENSDTAMEVAGFFYDEDDKLVMFVSDDIGRINQVDYRLYVKS